MRDHLELVILLPVAEPAEGNRIIRFVPFEGSEKCSVTKEGAHKRKWTGDTGFTIPIRFGTLNACRLAKCFRSLDSPGGIGRDVVRPHEDLLGLLGRKAPLAVFLGPLVPALESFGILQPHVVWPVLSPRKSYLRI